MTQPATLPKSNRRSNIIYTAKGVEENLVMRALYENRYDQYFLNMFTDSIDKFSLVTKIRIKNEVDIESKTSCMNFIFDYRYSRKLPIKSIIYPYSTIKQLCKKIKLTNTEGAVLLLLILRENDKLWRRLLSDELSKLKDQISGILKINTPKLSKIISDHGKIRKSGLLQPTDRFVSDLDFKVLPSLNKETIADYDEWLLAEKEMFNEIVADSVTLGDFSYIEEITNSTIKLLKNSLEKQFKGIHILLYGKPGTGKSTLASVMANEIKARLLDINRNNCEGYHVNRSERFQSYLYGQQVLGHEKNVLFLFDEMEDIFPDTMNMFSDSSLNNYKGMVNEILEQSSIPTIWTCNKIGHIDRAILRRFTVILEIPSPPVEHRRELLHKCLEDFNLSAAWLDSVAKHEPITPAYVKKIKDISSLIKDDVADQEKMISTLLQQDLQAMGYPKVRFSSESDYMDYDLRYLNTDADIRAILHGLKINNSGRLCLYGLSGTGKTRFAKYLAEQLGKNLVLKRPSDIFGKFIGETEENIASIFKEAEDSDAVLLLDEADGIFHNRENAYHSWEINQVNELLGQLEDFNGIFIASTNILDLFDQASFRRFDFKIRFNPLTHEQACEVFSDILSRDGQSSVDLSYYKQGLKKYQNLTIGNFHCALRKIKLMGQNPDADRLYNTIRQETTFSANMNDEKGIGFTAEVA